MAHRPTASETEPAPPEGWVEIGRIGRPHGVHGAVHIRLFNDDSDLLEVGRVLAIRTSKQWHEMTVENVIATTAVKFAGVAGRDAADNLKHADVYALRSDFPPLDDDEVYLADLIDATVYDDKGTRLGVAESFDDNGAQPLLQVRTEDRRLVDVPFVGALVESIEPDPDDEERSRIVLQLPEGLFDESAALVSKDAPSGPKSPRGRAKQRREATAGANAPAPPPPGDSGEPNLEDPAPES